MTRLRKMLLARGGARKLNVSAAEPGERHVGPSGCQPLSGRESPSPLKQCHRQVGSHPRSRRGKADVNPVLRIADHGKCGQQIPHAAPGGRRQAAARGDRSIEQHVYGVGRCCGGENADCQPWVNSVHCVTSRGFIWRPTPLRPLQTANPASRHYRKAHDLVFCREVLGRAHGLQRGVRFNPWCDRDATVSSCVASQTLEKNAARAADLRHVSGRCERDIHLVELKRILLARMLCGHRAIAVQHIGHEVQPFLLGQVLRPLDKRHRTKRDKGRA
jgi:hypothetical protein